MENKKNKSLFCVSLAVLCLAPLPWTEARAQIRVSGVGATSNQTYNITNSADALSLQVLSGTMRVHPNVFYFGDHYGNLSALATAASGKLFWLRDGIFTAETMPVLSAATRGFDFRNDRFDFWGLATWGHKGWVQADSVQDFKTIYRSVINKGGVINLGKGTFSFDSLMIRRPVRIQGSVTKRYEEATGVSEAHGAVLKSTATSSSKHLLWITTPGVDLDNVMLQGSSLNGAGVYAHYARDSSGVFLLDRPITSMGDYNFRNIVSSYHGRDGARLVIGDGTTISNSDFFFNRGFGINLISPYGNYLDGLEALPTAAIAGGINNKVWDGRTRRNSLGGINIFQNNWTGLYGTESIGDTVVNLQIRGRGTGSLPKSVAENGTYSIGGDYEFAIPALHTASVPVANIKLHNTRSNTFINNYWGSVYPERRNDTTDVGTNTTQIVNNDLVANVDDYYNYGWTVTNTTLDSPAVDITDYVASTKTLTLATAIPGQTHNQFFTLEKAPNRGVWADSVYAAFFLNNAMSSNADTTFTVQHFGNFLFMGSNQNFDPFSDIVDLTSDTNAVNWGSISIDKLNTNGHFRIDSNTRTKLWVSGHRNDSLIVYNKNAPIDIRAGRGFSLNTVNNVLLDIQNDADTSVALFRNCANNERQTLKIYSDTDTTAGVQRDFISLGAHNTNAGAHATSAKPGGFLISNSSDRDKLYFGLPVEISGSDTSERYIDFLVSSRAPVSPVPVETSRLRLFNKANKLWTASNTAGDTLNITPYAGSKTWDPASADHNTSITTDVTVTGAAVGDVVSVGFTSITAAYWYITAVVSSANTVTVSALNLTGGTVNLSSGTLKARVWK